MREDMRAKKQGTNPNGAEDCGFRKFSRRWRRADKRRMGSVFVGTGSDRSNCTTMLGTRRVGVDALMQLR